MSSLFVLLARVLETIFIVGSIGSAVVFILSSIEDIKILVGMEDDDSQS